MVASPVASLDSDEEEGFFFGFFFVFKERESAGLIKAKRLLHLTKIKAVFYDK